MRASHASDLWSVAKAPGSTLLAVLFRCFARGRLHKQQALGIDLCFGHWMGISCLHGLCSFHRSIPVGTLARQPSHQRSFVQGAHLPRALHAPRAARFAAETSEIFEATPAVGILGTRKHGGPISRFVLWICFWHQIFDVCHVARSP